MYTTGSSHLYRSNKCNKQYASFPNLYCHRVWFFACILRCLPFGYQYLVEYLPGRKGKPLIPSASVAYGNAVYQYQSMSDSHILHVGSREFSGWMSPTLLCHNSDSWDVWVVFLDISSEFKYLGLFVASDLRWSSCINYTLFKALRKLYFFRRQHSENSLNSTPSLANQFWIMQM